MNVSLEVRNHVVAQAQGAMALYAVFIGVANPLWSASSQQERNNLSGSIRRGQI
jgi:hypothetical protein